MRNKTKLIKNEMKEIIKDFLEGDYKLVSNELLRQELNKRLDLNLNSSQVSYYRRTYM